MQPLSAAQADATDQVPFFAVGICRVLDSVLVLYQIMEADVPASVQADPPDRVPFVAVGTSSKMHWRNPGIGSSGARL